MKIILDLVFLASLAFPIDVQAQEVGQNSQGEKNQTEQVEVINRRLGGLTDSDEHTTQNADSNLAGIGPPAVAELHSLTRALSFRSNTEVRIKAARDLGALGPYARKAVPNLLTALSDQSDRVRIEAAKALGNIGPEAAGIAVDDILSMLGDEDLYVRRAASESLALLEKKAIPGLIKSLEHQNAEVRYRASSALARMSIIALEALEKALESDKVFVRQGAAIGFARQAGVQHIEVVPMLVKRLQDNDKVVRQWAAWTLSRYIVDSDAAMSALLVELASDNDFAFEIVVLLSRWVYHENFLQKLLQAYNETSSQLIRAIGMAGYNGRKAIPVLQEALNDEQTRYHAAEALFRIVSSDDEVKRQIDAYFKSYKLEGPYPGYKEDLRLSRRMIETEGPMSVHSPSEAILAGSRLFGNVDIVGKSKKEVVEVFGEPRFILQNEDETETLIYSFDSGFNGVAFKVLFSHGRGFSVKTVGID